MTARASTSKGAAEGDADDVVFRLVDIPLSGTRDGYEAVEQQIARLAADGWEPISFNRLSVNGAMTFLLRRAGHDRLI